MLEAEIRSLQRRLVRRDNDILKQERELHKLRSVLQQASSLMSAGDDHILSSIQETTGVGAASHSKKQGVSGQSLAVSRDLKVAKHSKDFRSRTLIKEARWRTTSSRTSHRARCESWWTRCTRRLFPRESTLSERVSWAPTCMCPRRASTR